MRIRYHRSIHEASRVGPYINYIRHGSSLISPFNPNSKGPKDFKSMGVI